MATTVGDMNNMNEIAFTIDDSGLVKDLGGLERMLIGFAKAMENAFMNAFKGGMLAGRAMVAAMGEASTATRALTQGAGTSSEQIAEMQKQARDMLDVAKALPLAAEGAASGMEKMSDGYAGLIEAAKAASATADLLFGSEQQAKIQNAANALQNKAQAWDEQRVKIAQLEAQMKKTYDFEMGELEKKLAAAQKAKAEAEAMQESYNMAGQKDKAQQLDQVLNDLAKTVGELSDRQERMADYGPNTSEYRDLAEALALAANKAAILEDETVAAAGQLKSMMGQVDEKLANALFTGMTNGVKNAGKAMTEVFSKLKLFGKGLISVAQNSDFVFKGLAKVGSFLKGTVLKKGMDAAVSAFKEGFGELAKYSGSVGTAMNGLKAETEYFKANIAAAFSPIISAVVPMLATLMGWVNAAANALGQLVASLFGNGTYTKAVKQQQGYADSLGGTAAAATEAAEAMGSLSIDEFNTISDQGAAGTAGGGGGGGSIGTMFEEVEIDDIFKDLDARKLGEMLAGCINDALAAIPWGKIQDGARKAAATIADFLNSAVIALDWALLGYSIGQGINTALIFAYTFMSRFDWGELGYGIARGINSVIATTSWDLVGRTMASKWTALVDTLFEIVKFTKWSKIGDALGTAVVAWFEEIDWGKAGDTLGTGIRGLATTVSALVQKIDWGMIGQAINDFITSIDLKATFQAVIDAVIGLFDGLVIAIAAAFDIPGIEIFTSMLSGIFSLVLDNIPTILALLAGVGAAIAAMKVASSISNVVEKIGALSGGIGGLLTNTNVIVIAIGALVTILALISSASPEAALGIGLVATAIGILIFAMTGGLAGVVSLIVGAISGIAGLVKFWGSEALPEVERFNDSISTGTQEAVGAMMDCWSEAEISIKQMAWSGAEVTDEMTNSIVSSFRRMKDELTGALESQRAEAIDSLQYLFQEEAAIHDERLALLEEESQERYTNLDSLKEIYGEESAEYAEALSELESFQADRMAELMEGASEEELIYIERLNAINDSFDEQVASVEEKERQALEIQRAAAIEGRELKEDEVETLLALGYDLQDMSIDILSETEEEARAIHEQMSENAELEATHQALAIVQQSEIARDGAIAAANEEYEAVVAAARQQALEHGTISEEQMLDIIAKAEESRDGAVAAAEEAHANVIEQAELQAAEHLDIIDITNGKSKTKWGAFWDNAKTGWSNFWNKVTGNSKDAADDMVELTGDMSDGMTGGIEDSQDDMVKAFGDNNDAAQKRIRKDWDSHSPSKVMRKIFGDVGDGMILGIEDSRGGMLDTFKSIFNEVLGATEGFVNSMLGAWGDMLSQIARAASAVPNAPHVSVPHLSNISIPRLAQGAVIPANREFLAVLGDQRHGTNLEAPADLIRQIVREEAGQGGVDAASIGQIARSIAREMAEMMQVTVEVDSREIARANTKGQRQLGGSYGGAFAYAK